MDYQFRRLLPDINPDPHWRAKLAEAKVITDSSAVVRRPTRASREREFLDGR